MKRLNLVHARGGSITADTAEALRRLETRAAERGNVILSAKATPYNPNLKYGAWSIIPSGRQISLGLVFVEPEVEPELADAHALAILWALAIPCGFTPAARYPIPGDRRPDEFPDEPMSSFHCFGPWQILYDHLMGEGRGEAAWPSVCCAAQVDVGTWQGDRALERFIQAQLHRVGVNVGPIDGQIAHRSLTGLKRLGLDSMPLSDAAARIADMGSDQPKPHERSIGHVIAPGADLTIVSSGRVHTTKTATGAALTIDGPGRVVIDFTPKG